MDAVNAAAYTDLQKIATALEIAVRPTDIQYLRTRSRWTQARKIIWFGVQEWPYRARNHVGLWCASCISSIRVAVCGMPVLLSWGRMVHPHGRRWPQEPEEDSIDQSCYHEQFRPGMVLLPPRIGHFVLVSGKEGKGSHTVLVFTLSTFLLTSNAIS